MSALEDLSADLLPSSWTRLHLASYTNDTEALESLVARYPEKINSLDANGRSPLQIAFESRYATSMGILIRNGASLDTLYHNNLKGTRVFDRFVELGIQVLYSTGTSIQLDVSSRFLHSALCHLISADDIPSIDKLYPVISRDNRIITKHDNIGLTPLHYVAIKGDTRCAQLLLDHSDEAKSGVASVDLATPVHYACRHGHIEMVDLLLKESPDPNELLLRQDIKGCTPTHWALYNEHWDLLIPLLTSYQDLFSSLTNITDCEGYTVRGLLFHLRQKVLPASYQSCIPCLSVEEANWLLHNGVSDQNEEMTIHALDQGADPSVFDYCHQTPLLLAAKLGSTSICNLLLKSRNPPDVNTCDYSGRTPLHYASRNGHISTVYYLLEQDSINLYFISADGCIPLELALQRGNVDVVKALLDASSKVGVDGFHGDWMKLLTLAAASIDDVSILRAIIKIFCPSDWSHKILDSSAVFIPSTFTRKPISTLKVFDTLLPAPKLFRNDIIHPSEAKKKFESHLEQLGYSNQAEFTPHRLFDCSKRQNKKKFILKQKKLYHNSPLHDSLSARNKSSSLYLLNEVRRAGYFSKFLSLKSNNGITGAMLLADVIYEGSILIEESMEQELFDYLVNEWSLPEGVPFGWAVLHYLILNLPTKGSCSKYTVRTPLQKCSIWLISKYISQNYCQISNNHIDFTDSTQILKIAAVILEREHYNVFESKKIDLPCSSNPHHGCSYPSLVSTSVVRRVSIEFLEVLLTKGDTSFTSCIDLQSNPEGKVPDRSKRSFRTFLRFHLSEALILGSVDHAKLILGTVNLSTYFSSFAASLAGPFVGTDVEGSSCFYLELTRGIYHLVAADTEFEFVTELLQQFPEDELQRYLLLDNRSIRVLYLSLLSKNGVSLGRYLLNGYLHYFSSIIRDCALNGSSAKINNNRFSIILKQFLRIVELFSKCLWTYEKFDLFRDFVTFCYYRLTCTNISTPILHQLCGDGQTDLVQLILTGQSKDFVLCKDEDGYTPIYIAAFGGHIEILEFLLNQGVSVDDPSMFGTMNPFLAVLLYLHYAPLYYRKGVYNKFHRIYRICTRPSKVFEDMSQAKKLVNLVKPPPDKLSQLEEPLSYVEALVKQPDFRPVSDFMSESSLMALMSLANIDDGKFLDNVLRRTRHFNFHPSPDLCLMFLKVLCSYVPLTNPSIAASKCYWDLIPSSLSSYSSSKKSWIAVFSVALRNKKKGIAQSILQKALQENDVSNFPEYVKILCTYGHCCQFLEKILRVSLVDEAISIGLRTAAAKGNLKEFKMLAGHRPSVLVKGLTQILSLSARNGHKDIVQFLYSFKDHVKCDGLENGTSLSFWVTVLCSATQHGRSHLSLVAVGNLSYSEAVSLSTWKGFMSIINSCCWWGMADVLEALAIDNHSIYLSPVHNVTPFESACSSGNFGKLSSVSGFPDISQLVQCNFVPSEIIQSVSCGWWCEAMNISSSNDKNLAVRNGCFNLSSESVKNFVSALENNMVVFVQAFLSKWGSEAGAILNLIGRDVLYSAVKSGNPSLFEMIVKTLFDSGIKIIPSTKCVSVVLLKNDLSMLRSMNRFVDFSALNIESGGYSVLHLVALYCQSEEICDLILTSVTDSSCLSLLAKKDFSGFTPLDCALSMGNYSTAAKFVVKMTKSDQTVKVSPNEVKYARGWFRKLMSANELTQECTSVTFTKSIRDAKSIKQYYDSIKNTGIRPAGILLEASLGTFSLNSSVCAHSIECGSFILTLPLLNMSLLSNWLSTEQPVKLIKKGHIEQVIDMLKYIETTDIRRSTAGDEFNNLFNVACSCSAIKLVQYILESNQVDSDSIIKGFKTAYVLGHLEVAAYILLYGKLCIEDFQSEVIEVNTSDIVQLIFFGKPEQIVDAICTPGDVTSRLCFAQIWLMYPWGKFQTLLLENRLSTCYQLINDWSYELSTDTGNTVYLQVDNQSFSDCLNKNTIPLYQPVVTIASCVSQLYSLSRCPPSYSLTSLFGGNSSIPEQITLSCVSHPSVLVANSNGYHGNITVTYDPQSDVFEWPVTQVLSQAEGVVSVSDEQISDPMEFIQNVIEFIVSSSNLDFPVAVSLDDISDYVKMKSLQHDMSFLRYLFCVMEQSVKDVASVLKLINVPAAIYSNILPPHYCHRFNSFFVTSVPITGVSVSFDISMSSDIVSNIADDGQLNILIHLELIDKDDTSYVTFAGPSLSELTTNISNELMAVEWAVLQSNLINFINKFVSNCSSLSAIDLFFDSTSLRDCAVESMYFAKLHPLIKRFLRYFIDVFSLVESSRTSFSYNNLSVCIRQSPGIEITDTTLKLGVADLTKHRMHLAIKQVLHYYASKFHGLKESISDIPVPSLSCIPLDANYKLLMSLTNSCVVDLCNINNDVIQTKSLDTKSMFSRLSFNVRKLPVSNSPLKYNRNDVPPNNYHVQGDVPVISLLTDDTLTCIVSHPNGGCTCSPRIVLPHYTPVRQLIAPLKDYKRDNLIAAVSKGYPIHYISCLRDSDGNMFQISTAVNKTRSAVQFLVLKSKCEPKGTLVVLKCHSLGSGVYLATFKCTGAMFCQIVSVCLNCQCLMKVHWSHGSSVLPQPCLFLPGKLDPQVSFVAFKENGTEGENIKPFKAGSKLELYLFTRDKSNNTIHYDTPPQVLLQLNDSYLSCNVSPVQKKGVFLIKYYLTLKGRYNIVIKQDSTYLSIASFDVHSVQPFVNNCIINLPVVSSRKTLSITSPSVHASFTVQLYDKFNNLISDTRKYRYSMQAKLRNKLNKKVQYFRVYAEEGTIVFRLHLSSEVEGDVRVTFDADELPDSPVAISVYFNYAEMSFSERRIVLLRILKQSFSQGYTPTLTIDRRNILESSVQALAPPNYFNQTIRVRFGNEPGIDDSGLSREFFHLLSQELVNPQYALFQVTSTGLYKPNPFSSVNSNHLFYFEFCGKILAKSICEGYVLNVRFTPAVYKFIVSKSTTTEDLKEEDVSLYNGLQHVLNCSSETEIQSMTTSHMAELEKFGSLVSVELVHGGKDKPVTLENRQEYVKNLSYFYTTGCIKEQLLALNKGFSSLSNEFLVKYFTPMELEYMISGEKVISLNLLRSKVKYDGYHPTSKQIEWLWNTLKSFSQEDISKFLQFVSGFPVIPVDTKWQWTVSKSLKDSSHLPLASTCSSCLHLPVYANAKELEHKLKLALSHGGGFYLQ